ncbi:hypothetical protein BG61_05745 [Caballeronia glathei]|uniref:Uncharacterized protein n=1 Tax=Caballeronia glathei TaxID=60547 RepID=A0A069PB69_9BURK|nr:hypothetical protein BG61_05745 [Caballeronia glathei]
MTATPAAVTPGAATPRTATTAAATYGPSAAAEPRTATRMPATDTDNPDELERAIKQFGWSGGDTMPRRRAEPTGSP